MLLLLQELNALFSEIYSVYQHFIGQPHFDALLELLSYQDVAVLLKELLESVKSLVCYFVGILLVLLSRALRETESACCHRHSNRRCRECWYTARARVCLVCRLNVLLLHAFCIKNANTISIWKNSQIFQWGSLSLSDCTFLIFCNLVFSYCVE